MQEIRRFLTFPVRTQHQFLLNWMLWEKIEMTSPFADWRSTPNSFAHPGWRHLGSLPELIINKDSPTFCLLTDIQFPSRMPMGVSRSTWGRVQTCTAHLT